MELAFSRGTIIIRGDIRVPNSTWDERSRTFRAVALHYRDIIDYLETSGMDFKDNVLDLIPCPELQTGVILRDYQQQALGGMGSGGRRG